MSIPPFGSKFWATEVPYFGTQNWALFSKWPLFKCLGPPAKCRPGLRFDDKKDGDDDLAKLDLDQQLM